MQDIFRYLMSKWVYGYAVPLGVIDKLGLRRGGLLVIVGSGIGQTSIMAAKRIKCRVLGLELYSQLVEEAERRANKLGLGGLASFSKLSEDSGAIDADALFFESVLSFVEDPETLMDSCVERISFSRLGILEPAWLTSSPSEEMIKAIHETFGYIANFRQARYWEGLLGSRGLYLAEKGIRRIGIMRKFWDDFRASPPETLVGLTKTLYKTMVDRGARIYMDSFRAFVKKLSRDVAYAYYVATPKR